MTLATSRLSDNSVSDEDDDDDDDDKDDDDDNEDDDTGSSFASQCVEWDALWWFL